MAKKESIYDNNISSLIANNSRAYFEYFIEDIYEAGLVLYGTEVKSLRQSKPSLVECHASYNDGGLFLHNLHINEYEYGNRNNHYPKRPKKLLLHKKEIKKLIGVVQRKGMTLVPLKMYFNKRNIVKVLIGVARGKKLHDKRQTIKERDLKREQVRGLRD
jgi:SsrA-binding protein